MDRLTAAPRVHPFLGPFCPPSSFPSLLPSKEGTCPCVANILWSAQSVPRRLECHSLHGTPHQVDQVNRTEEQEVKQWTIR